MTPDGKLNLGLSVESQTEENFIKVVICPYFEPKGLFIVPESIGGNVSVDKFKHRIRKFFYKYDHVGAFYDFSGFNHRQQGETRTSLEHRLVEAVEPRFRRRFIPYVQMYEFEALLFSDPRAIAAQLGDKSVTGWAQNILRKVGNNPERINDSSATAPSRRIVERARYYEKVEDGPEIAARIGIDKMRERCAGFNDWLEKLERLAP